VLWLGHEFCVVGSWVFQEVGVGHGFCVGGAFSFGLGMREFGFESGVVVTRRR
jgi:hypothetical protein